MKRHYLGNVYCPLNRAYSCTAACAWFDHEEDMCRLLGIMFDVNATLLEVVDKLDEIKDEVYQLGKRP